jgi:hypothetical protein
MATINELCELRADYAVGSTGTGRTIREALHRLVGISARRERGRRSAGATYWLGHLMVVANPGSWPGSHETT